MGWIPGLSKALAASASCLPCCWCLPSKPSPPGSTISAIYRADFSNFLSLSFQLPSSSLSVRTQLHAEGNDRLWSYSGLGLKPGAATVSCVTLSPMGSLSLISPNTSGGWGFIHKSYTLATLSSYWAAGPGGQWPGLVHMCTLETNRVSGT